MKKPTLLHMTPQGATKHSFHLEGGQTTFQRFLGFIEGSCEFFDTKEDATNYVYKILT